MKNLLVVLVSVLALNCGPGTEPPPDAPKPTAECSGGPTPSGYFCAVGTWPDTVPTIRTCGVFDRNQRMVQPCHTSGKCGADTSGYVFCRPDPTDGGFP